MNTSVSPPKPIVALIAGPTASGKSALAMALAERVGGVVINSDSAQVYRDLRVLSARPSIADEARVPHRLFGYIDGTASSSAASWAGDAAQAIDAAHADGRLPVLVGGTGMYIRTLIDGIAPIPPIDEAVRQAVRAMPVTAAYEALRAEDPVAAARLNAADTARVARALEVVRSTGHPLDHWHKRLSGGIGHRLHLMPLVMLPDRTWLFERCDQRLATMFDEGGVEEVRALIARPDILPDAPIRRAIGVPEIADWLAGRIDRETALARARLSTRQYAKRQYTWFRNQSPPDWPRSHDTSTATLLDYFSLIP